MAELHLIRHGQASFGAENYDRLSDIGTRQARWLGEYFADSKLCFDRVVIGTMRRHRQTADAILEGLGSPVVEMTQHAGLNEYDFDALYRAAGDDNPALSALAQGTKRDFYVGLKQVLHLWSEDRLPGPVPETWQQFQGHVRDARLAIQRGGGQRVLLVSSGGPIAVVAQQVLQAPDATAIALNMQMRNSSVCQYFFNADAMSLASFNCVPHLDRPERREFVTYG
ncbi:broad specificity phosphatase PhoE [Paraburkholderia sp. Clong3]|uniref:histidine phosphatase family protein n=1 Tax=Paraburkholderia sp. Clong3 TaxID=2991061 RepID=UPI003D20FC53